MPPPVLPLPPVCGWLPAPEGQTLSLPLRLPLHRNAHQGDTRFDDFTLHANATQSTYPENIAHTLFLLPLSLSPSPPPLLPSSAQACADKLKLEMEEYGFPPDFPREKDRGEVVESKIDPADPTKRLKKVDSFLS